MTYKEQGMGVVTAIGAIKWVIIAIQLTVGIVTALVIETRTTLSRSYEVGFLTATTVLCLGVWVLFGWFEHTLANFIRIEWNTRQAVRTEPAPVYPPRPAPTEQVFTSDQQPAGVENSLGYQPGR